MEGPEPVTNVQIPHGTNSCRSCDSITEAFEILEEHGTKGDEALEAQCRGCRDLKQALANNTNMTEAANEYLSILTAISSDLQDLITEMPAGVFQPLTETLLPQGLENTIQDPRQITKQLINICRNCMTQKRELETKTNKIEDLQKDLETKAKKIEDLQRDLKAKSKTIEDLQKDLQTQTKTNNDLMKTKHDLNDRIAHISQWIATNARFSCVIPRSAHEDDRITSIMSELMQCVNTQMRDCAVNVISMPGPDIDLSVGMPVILPCIAASRVGSDISAALTKAKIASGQVILVIFHHLAPHNSKINTPTEQRLSDRTLLDQCVGMVDAVFWNGAMYDCAANYAAVRRIQQLFQWSLSIESLKELKRLVQLN